MNGRSPSDEPPAEWAAELEVFHGELSPARALVFVRLPWSAAPEGCRLNGTVVGPFREGSETLPMRAVLADMGPGPTRLLRAILVDPSYWSPDAPNEYRVQLELQADGRSLGPVTRRIGLRAVAASGPTLLRENKPWIVRGVFLSPGEAPESNLLRAGGVAVVTASDLAAVTPQAEQTGTYLLADVTTALDPAAAVRLAVQSPAVFGLIAAPSAPWRRFAELAPNLVLLAQVAAPAEAPAEAQGVVAAVADPEAFAAQWRDFSRPVFARRPAADLAGKTPLERRAACDQLQRDLAPYGQFAGYLA